MSQKQYTSERNALLLVALMKAHNIKKVVISPGTTNICLSWSLQHDPFFELYSSVDERSAAYIACGLATETGEAVALSCTGSTASRNYMPALTEAYYRKLPVLAITASQHMGRVGQNFPQFIDRSVTPNDVVKFSASLPEVHTADDEWSCGVAINKALIALKKNGGGPAHINLVTSYSRDYSVKELPAVKAIRHVSSTAEMPSLEQYRKIAILVGAHPKWPEELTNAVDSFCRAYNAVVLMNHTSNYKGEFGVDHNLIINMKQYTSAVTEADLVIYIGSISRFQSGMRNPGCVMWRVNPDGEIRDPERRLTHVFALDEMSFFMHYNALKEENIDSDYARLWQKEYNEIITQVPELPFSNVWVAEKTIQKLPADSVLHLAGSNTARAWNYFKLPKTIDCYSNDGAMDIDGQVSALIGESLAAPNKLHFGVVGDLTFFYDMNSLGNRHIRNNLRLMVVNNGKGGEFKIYSHPAAMFEEAADPFMAAAGHFGNKSPDLIRHYAGDLGYEYLFATTKEEFLASIERFLIPVLTEKSMIFEVFTDSEDESNAIYEMNHIVKSTGGVAENFAKNAIRSLAGEKGIAAVKKFIKH